MKKESFDFSLGTDVSGRRTKIGKNALLKTCILFRQKTAFQSQAEFVVLDIR